MESDDRRYLRSSSLVRHSQQWGQSNDQERRRRRKLDRDERRNAPVALALLLDTLLEVSAIAVGMNLATYQGGVTSSADPSVEVVEEGVNDALSSNTTDTAARRSANFAGNSIRSPIG